jgi:hypothetical protein
MKISISLFILFALLSSCNKEQLVDACHVDNPTEKVIWLKEKVAQLEKSLYCQSIRQFSYQGQKVFVVGTCEPNFNSVDQIYDCEGNLICGWGDPKCPQFEAEAQFEKLLWRSH